MLEKIQSSFTESIQTQIATAELLPKIINDAASRIVACLLRGNKIIVCGHGRSYSNAQILTSHLLHRYELARPSFSALLLEFNPILSAISAQDNELDLIYKKQLQATVKQGDIFVAFSPLGDENAIIQTIHCANNENLEILAFTSSRNDHIQGMLDDNDLEISIPSTNEMRIIEGHLFCVNLLCELIDHLLFS